MSRMTEVETEKIARRMSCEHIGSEALWEGFLIDAYREYFGTDEMPEPEPPQEPAALKEGA